MTTVNPVSGAGPLRSPIRIAAFEYGCCRTPPRVGETVTGRLSAYPASDGRAVVTGWDRDRDVVVAGGTSARWDPAHGDPLGQPIALTLSWHDDSPGGVEATGVVSSVYQVFYAPDPDSERPRVALRQSVTAVEKFPTELVQDDGAVLVPGGVEVFLDELVLVEPTLTAVAAARAAADQARRTLTLMGPAPCFGTIVPYARERIRIDLDDDRLTISGAEPGQRGVVSGIATQVGRAASGGMVGVIFPVPIDAGIPSAEAEADLLVVFVVDPAD